jgi:methyl-accepting chemotaxis protein
MKLNYILIGSFLIVALLVGVVGIVSTSSLSTFDETVDILAEEHLPIEEALHEIKESVLQEIRHADDYIFGGDIHHKEELEKYHQQFEAAAAAAAAAAHDPLEHGYFEHVVEVGGEIQELHHEFDEKMEATIALYEQNPDNIAGVLALRQEMHDIADELFVHVDELIESEHHEVEDTKELIHTTEDRLRYMIWGTVLLAIILSIALGFFVSYRITKPITELTNAADSISKGNLDVTIDVKSSDELGKLAESFSFMRASLKAVIKQYESMLKATKVPTVVNTPPQKQKKKVVQKKSKKEAKTAFKQRTT